MSKNAAAPKFRSPHDDPRMLEMSEKRRRLMDRQAELQAELDAIPKGATDTKARAALLLEGRDPNVEEERIQRSSGAIQRDLQDHALAIRLLDGQKDQLLEQIRREYRRELLPDHARVALQVAAAIRNLADAIEAEEHFRDELGRAQIFHGSPMQPGTVHFAGRLGREAVDFIRNEAAPELERAHEPLLNGKR